MPTKYLILRSSAPHEDNYVHLSRPRGSTGNVGNLSIATVDGHDDDGEALRADPLNVAVADAEALFALIKPVAAEVADPVELPFTGSVRMPVGLLVIGAHTTPFTGEGVAVAVLDTGIDETHPVFATKTVIKRNFTGVGPLNDVTDFDGHGTHCAGTICGGVVDDVRIGVAPGVSKLCVAKVLGGKGSTLETLCNAMYWAVIDERAAVVSMSLNYDLPGNTARHIAKGMPPALATQAALRQQRDIMDCISKLRTYLESRSGNVVFAGAAGNESARPDFVIEASLPAAELLPVGAVELGSSGRWSVAKFSNSRPAIVAPGVDVVSAALGKGWSTMSGTSMATPHVAGVAALWAQKLINDGGALIPGSVRASVVSHATFGPFERPLIGGDIGMGMVQAPQ